MSTFTLIHVLISLVGIGSGFVVLFGLINSKPFDGLTALFLTTTAATSITGFLFPFHVVTPGIVVGVLSLIVLALACAARYAFHMAGGWRTTWVITAAIAEYFNVFVLVAQLFQKVPALQALAPTQSEPPFAVAQLVVLVLFAVLTFRAVKKFRPEARRPSLA
jgi:hypothetical protein